jgi:hypothetical protein
MAGSAISTAVSRKADLVLRRGEHTDRPSSVGSSCGGKFITGQQPGEFLITSAKRLLQQYLP